MSRTPLEVLDAEIRNEHVPGFVAEQLQQARDDVPLIDPGKVADQLTAMLSRQLSDEGFDR